MTLLPRSSPRALDAAARFGFALLLIQPGHAEASPPLQQAVFDAYQDGCGMLFHIAHISGDKKQPVALQHGVLLDRSGLLLTLDRVAARSGGRLLASGSANKIYAAELHRRDEVSGIALVKLRDFEFDERRHATLRFSTRGAPAVGQAALVVSSIDGSSEPAVSLGIVSCADRGQIRLSEYAKAEREHFWLQTDAAVNSGDHGAPLLNARGELLGVCVAPTGSKQFTDDLGFAIPSGYIAEVVRRLRELDSPDATIDRGWLGITPQAYAPTTVEGSLVAGEIALKENDRGVKIGKVEANRAAEYAGLRAGDLLISIAGQPLSLRHTDRKPEFTVLCLELKPGKAAEVVFYRDRERRTAEITPLAKGEVAADWADPESGLYLNEVTPERQRRLKLPDTNGLLVAGVRKTSPAERAKIRSGLRIVSVSGENVSKITGWKRAIQGATGNVEIGVELRKGDKWKAETRTLKLETSEGKP